MRVMIIFEPDDEEIDESSDTGLTEEAYLQYSRHFGSLETIEKCEDDD